MAINNQQLEVAKRDLAGLVEEAITYLRNPAKGNMSLTPNIGSDVSLIAAHKIEEEQLKKRVKALMLDNKLVDDKLDSVSTSAEQEKYSSLQRNIQARLIDLQATLVKLQAGRKQDFTQSLPQAKPLLFGMKAKAENIETNKLEAKENELRSSLAKRMPSLNLEYTVKLSIEQLQIVHGYMTRVEGQGPDAIDLDPNITALVEKLKNPASDEMAVEEIIYAMEELNKKFKLKK